MSSAVKLSAELVESARAESEISSRSMTQQIEHWARIGRALERSPSVRLARVQAALRGELRYDDLGTDERAAFRGGLEARVFDPAGDDRLGRELLEAGRAHSGLDEKGRLVRVPPPGTGGVRASRPVRRVAAKRVRRKR